MNINVLHPWHGVPCGESAPRVVNAIIEIPQGSRCKYEIDKPSGLLRLDRIIYSSFHYPVNYGFIPQTYGGDKDPLDILVITSLPVQPLHHLLFPPTTDVIAAILLHRSVISPTLSYNHQSPLPIHHPLQ